MTLYTYQHHNAENPTHALFSCHDDRTAMNVSGEWLSTDAWVDLEKWQ